MLTGLMRLEERIVLDASGAAPEPDHDADRGGAGDGADSGRDGEAGSGQAGARVLVVDKALAGSSQLAEAAGDGVVVVEHDSRSGTLSELRDMIAAACEGRDILSIALAGHGEQAYFRLAQDAAIDPASLASDPMLADFLRFIAETVGEDGRVDILGCDFAAGDAGADLLAALESLTGVNFAASDDGTGTAERGGDWLLESDDIDAARDYFDAERLSDFSGLLATNTFFDYYPESLKPVEGEGLFQSKPMDLVDLASLIERSYNAVPHAPGNYYGWGYLHFTINYSGNASGQDLDDFVGGIKQLSGLAATYFSWTTPSPLGSAYWNSFVRDSATGDIFRVDGSGKYMYVATWDPATPNQLTANYDFALSFLTGGPPGGYFSLDWDSTQKDGYYFNSTYYAITNDVIAANLEALLNDGLKVTEKCDGGTLTITSTVRTMEYNQHYPGETFSAVTTIAVSASPVPDPVDPFPGNRGGSDSGGERDGERQTNDRIASDTITVVGDDGANGDADPGDRFRDFMGGRGYEWTGDLGGVLRDTIDSLVVDLGRMPLAFADFLGGDFAERISDSLNELLSGLNTLNAATAKMLLDFSEMDASTGARLSDLVGELANRGESLGTETVRAASGLAAFARAWRLASPESRDGMSADRMTELGFRIEQLNFDLKAAILTVKAFSEQADGGAFDADALRAYVEERHREAQAMFLEARNVQDRMFFDIKASRARRAGGAPVAP